MRPASFVTALALLAFSPVLPAMTASDYSFQLHPVTDQLTQRTVTNIYQDSRDYLWLLSQDGLNRYDGYELESYQYVHGDDSSLSHNWTSGVVEDNLGRIWVSTRGGGLNLYDPSSDSFQKITWNAECLQKLTCY